MTNEEAIQVLKSMKSEESYNALIDLCNIAIEALQTKEILKTQLVNYYKEILRLLDYSDMTESTNDAIESQNDVIEVIRCKDCRFNKYPLNDLCLIKKAGLYPDDDDFCSYGERREK